MALDKMIALFYALSFTFLFPSSQCHGSQRKVHIVYMGERLSDSSLHGLRSHQDVLNKVLSSDVSWKDSIVHSYSRSFSGFAARLTDDEVARLSEMDEVISVLPNTKLQLHTTRSWNFMGFSLNATLRLPSETNVIVGVIDTGIWPESESFNDDGLGPSPSKWKGICQTGRTNFTCNNKLIGARYYNGEKHFDPADFRSPRDSIGHGTHTASTAAGRPVANASYFGLAEGVARGGVPEARIAVYKVCWLTGCSSADILAAFDDAIADGVDILSVSLGSIFPQEYFEDVIAIGTFHAMRRGILTSCSAGNAGPAPISIANYAPWTLTVAASSIDRKFVTRIALGNGKTYIGVSINSFNLDSREFPLMSGGDAVNVSAGSSELISSFCFEGSLNSQKVQGKIVLCKGVSSGEDILNANGIGVILSTFNPLIDVAFSWSIPAAIVSSQDADEIFLYIKTASNPTATILVSDEWADALAPVVVSFSSRGPNPITPEILKPDLTAPGVDIIASWSPAASPTFNPSDKRRVNFNIISGTSMSCPHVSGAAAYVKSVHPSWSPAAIKSALMTTAMIMDPGKNEDSEFAYGAGHINPRRAVNPGLVFDATENDYVNFLCKKGYNTTTLRRVTGDKSICSSIAPGKDWDLNYPSFALPVPDGGQASATFYRTVTNVGFPNSTYRAIVAGPPNLKITVQPATLTFSSVGEKQSFTVTVDGGTLFQQPIMSACITWLDGVHSVRTPLVAYTTILGAGVSLESTKLTTGGRFDFRDSKGRFFGN